MSTKVQQAVERFRSGFNCSQVVLSAYGEEFGLSRETALRVACGFGGGMGRMGGTCGAVTGAFMVIGLKFGNTNPEDKAIKQKTYDLVREFANRFEQRNGSVLCRDLLSCDISTSEGYKAAKERGVFKSVCPKLVADAAEILEEMLAENM